MSQRPSQFELFPQSDPSGGARSRPASPRNEIKLLTENLVILGVFVVMLMVLSFSLGVERGRSIVLEARQAGPRVEAGVVQDVPPRVVQKTVHAETSLSGAVTEVATVTELDAETKPAGAVTVAGETPKPADTAVTEEAKKTVDKVYTIQVASFRKLRSAKEEAEALKQKGYEAEVISKGKWSIVCVGQFVEKEAAQSFAQKLKHRYKDSLIRSL